MKTRHLSRFGVTQTGGVELLGVLVAGVIGMGMMFALMTSFQFAQRADRGVASNVELTQMGTTLGMILGTPQACAKSGLIGLTLNPASPSSTPIIIHFPGPTGPGAVFIKDGQVIGTRKTEAVRFTEMASTGMRGGNTVYFSTLETVAAVVGKATTVRNPTNETHVNLVLDAGNRVVECYQHSETPMVSATPPPTPSPSASPSPSPSPATTTYEFGGMYILATASTCPSNPNPLTGSTSCPRGFRAAFVGGVLCSPRDAATRKLFMCYKISS